MHDAGPGIIPARAGFTRSPPTPGHDRRDHPRSRGVYDANCDRAGCRRGSSPLARGLPPEVRFLRRARRIIPARAGFTGEPSRPGAVGVDHPRSRGVYLHYKRARAGRPGSSPLARGLLIDYVRDGDTVGIIPARAGFTRGAISWVAARGDHPRSRGVYPWTMTPYWARWGSSPLARGLHNCGQWARSGAGIIPARAGFTRPALQPGRGGEDHPRSRGVYTRSTWAPTTLTGSSPLARGLQHRLRLRRVFRRIIPARAGFTRASGRTALSPWDHPRSRGVYACAPATFTCVSGSSPLARGLLEDLFPERDDIRIIPARAGFTVEPGSQLGGLRDHPRSRGVYAVQNQCRRSFRGSSPLARGLRRSVRVLRAGPGIIPARAGFT